MLTVKKLALSTLISSSLLFYPALQAAAETPQHVVKQPAGGYSVQVGDVLVESRLAGMGDADVRSTLARKLCRLLPDLPPGIELGSLAGNSPLGIGRIFKLQGENDGTVLVEETRFPGMADHILLPVSHTGMLTDKRVAGQTAAFLRHGKFDR